MSRKIGEISISSSSEDVDIEWRIGNFFSLLQEDSAGYCSPDFSFGGETWGMGILPNGWTGRDTSGYVDLQLWKSFSTPLIRQAFSLSLKTVKGEKYNEKHCTKVFDDDDDEYHEFLRFIPRSELSRRRSELVPNGVLTVVCTTKNPASAKSDGNTGSASAECHHCKETFDDDSLSLHQNKCMHRPIKYPGCLDVIVLQKWLDKHVCQTERSEAGKGLGRNSENVFMEACTQTEKENAGNSKNFCVETSTQTGEENADEQFKEKFRNVYVDASTQTKQQNVSLISLPEGHDLMTDVKDLLKERRGIDVTFEVDTSNAKTEFFAHQLILALRSPYFDDLFYWQGNKKGHQIIYLKGINTKAFEQMIRYCYDYKPCLRTTNDACALFKVAFEFKVISLQNLCHTFFRHTKIEPENVFSILKISVEMEDKSLKDMCNKILQEKTREVMEAYDLCDVTPAMVYTLLKLPTLSLNSEYELIKQIFDWAKVKSEDKDSSSKYAREYLERLLKDMNFLALTMEEFAVLHKDNPEFFSSDEIASICLNIACPGATELPVWYDSDLKCRVYTGSKE